MSRGFPSLTALLGLLAVAGYQNRDKIGEMLSGLGGGASQPGGAQPAGSGQSALPGPLGGLFGGLAGQNAGGFLGGGLGDLMKRFEQNGQGDVAQSWVNSGPNKEIAPNNVERAIGADTLQELVQQTGMTKEEILSRLSRELPTAIDRYTPEGRLPA